jgi:hypothetical protein
VRRVTNTISTTPDGEVLLTFTFALGPNGPEDVGEEAESEARTIWKRADDTIVRTIKVVRELVKAGKV